MEEGTCFHVTLLYETQLGRVGDVPLCEHYQKCFWTFCCGQPKVSQGLSEPHYYGFTAFDFEVTKLNPAADLMAFVPALLLLEFELAND